MYPACTWDSDDARAWSVMGRVRDRHEELRNHVVQARRRVEQRERRAGQMPPAAERGAKRDLERLDWLPRTSVIALLFVQPDADAVRLLDARGDYFDRRTGDTWDLFFPGYYRSERGADAELSAGNLPIGSGYARNWYFGPFDFDILRRHVESQSERRWEYSGETDIVLVTVWMPEEGAPVVDWASTISGQLRELPDATRSLLLSEVVERVSRDLEQQLEDPAYGVQEVIDADGGSVGSQRAFGRLARDVLVQTIAAIVAAIVMPPGNQ